MESVSGRPPGAPAGPQPYRPGPPKQPPFNSNYKPEGVKKTGGMTETVGGGGIGLFPGAPLEGS